MAEDGPLSQADIDALTAGLLGDSAPPGPDVEALRPAAALFFEQASAVLGALLGRTAAVSPLDIRPADASPLDGAFGAEGLAVHAALGGGVEGDLLFALSKPTAAMLAGLMLGGDGTAPFKDEDIDAVNELANQILGSVCTALGGKLGLEVSASQASAAPLDPSLPPFPPEGAVVAEGELAVEGAEPAAFHLVLSRALADALAGGAQGGPASPSGTGGGLLSQGSFDDSLSRNLAEAPANVQMLLDINLNVTIELGRTRLSIRRILELGPGSIIELDRLAGEPVDLLVNDKVVAKGEVVVVDEYFGIRILSLVSPEERIKQLR